MLTTTSVFCSISGVNNSHLFVMNGIDTFPRNEICYEAVTSCQKQDVPIQFQFLLKTSSWQLPRARMLCQNYPRIFPFYLLDWIIWLYNSWVDIVTVWWGSHMGVWSKDGTGGIKPSRQHDYGIDRNHDRIFYHPNKRYLGSMPAQDPF